MDDLGKSFDEYTEKYENTVYKHISTIIEKYNKILTNSK